MKEGLNQTDNEWEQAGQALGMMLGGALVDRIVEELITSDNYLLFPPPASTGMENRR
jgi:hypothetical protein